MLDFGILKLGMDVALIMADAVYCSVLVALPSAKSHFIHLRSVAMPTQKRKDQPSTPTKQGAKSDEHKQQDTKGKQEDTKSGQEHKGSSMPNKR